MKKANPVVARNSRELASAFGLSPAEGAEVELRIVDIVARKKLTHAEVAKLARTSRTRVTAILNRNTKSVSTDLLLRVLYALGYMAKLRIKRAA